MTVSTQKLSDYGRLMRLNRPIGTFLLLWPTLWALWIAGQGHPRTLLVVIFICGVFIMRSAGCIINDIADRNFDDKVSRTKERPLATRAISVTEALMLFIFLCLMALTLLWPLNMAARLLAVPALILAVVYPFMKRYTHLPQLVLGLAFSWGIPMAFAAQTGTVPGMAWFLFLIACLWPVAYDTIYAMVDREDDKLVGVKSLAILLGKWDIAFIATLHAIMLLLFICLGIYLNMGGWFFAGLFAAAVVMGYQQYLIKDRRAAKCFQAFKDSQWAGLVIFVGILLDYWWITLR